jgi:hypothetical protein
MHRILIKSVAKVARYRGGSVAVQIGVMLTVLIGMVSLGTEIPFVLHKHRQLQAVVDMAAVSAAATRFEKDNLVALTEARAVAASAGLVHGQGGVTVQLSRPPTSGANAGIAEAVEVVISQPQTLNLAKVLGMSNFDMRVRSVAMQSRAGLYCILALDLGAPASVDLKANALLPNPACGVASNSASDTALVLGPSSTIKASTSVRGRISRAANAVLAGAANTQNGPNIDDPYRDVPSAPALPCTGQSGVGAAGMTFSLTPGHFCGGWVFGANVTLNLAPGIYIIDALLTLGDNAQVLAKGGVTLVVNGDYEMLIGNNVALGITAPTTGSYAGLAIFSRRTAAATTAHKFGKTLKLDIQGALYFPNQILELKTDISASGGCGQIIARLVRVENSVQMGNSCAGTGTRTITGATSYLVQ